MGSHEHKIAAPKSVTVGIITVSTTRSLETDESGHWIRAQATAEGHTVVLHRLVTDKETAIRKTVQTALRETAPQALILNGGTGISPTDVTIETLRPMFIKEMTAFGPLFALLSHRQIGSAAVLSRATAGVIERTVVICLPGSLNACRMAWQEMISSELSHMVHHVREG
ncbi:MAG: molybdenum cofactor biosynthesis protein B [Deltaproteobacteria bacterium SG8_13]|nr:MAG: molybdenum cofactor biosynthesis protein B [Deltaproteobacteria bacterium SG8_13]